MAAPTVTARILPTGYRLPDGFKSVIAFAIDPGIQLWEMQVKPPGVDGGEPIEFSTMLNIAWRTKRARHLKTLDMITFKFAYDPAVMNDIIQIVNLETSITHHWPDNTLVAFYGYLQKVEFDDLEEGKMPTGTATICPTNWDYINNIEVGPLVQVAAGTP
jgi:hypothetical protein